MAKQTFIVEYTFTSSKAYGHDYTLRLDIRADNEKAALNVAKIEGFSHFGARFNDNCYDWQIVEPRK